MKDTIEEEVQERFTQSSQGDPCIWILKPLDHRVHREHLGDLSVVSVRPLCDLCEKRFSFARLSRKFMNNPG